MNGEQLLEAIGQIDETLLRDYSGRRRKLLPVILAAVLLLAIPLSVGAAKVWKPVVGSITMANVVTAQGRFAYGDGYFYCGTEKGIYQMNEQTGRVRRIPLADGAEEARFLVVTETGLGYVTGKNEFIHRTPKGEEILSLPEESHLVNVYAWEHYLYTNNGQEFCRINMNTGEQKVLLNNVHGYWVEDDRIFALTEGKRFLTGKTDGEAFVSVPLSFHPAMVVAKGEVLYFSQYISDGRFRIIRYENGTETRLPITGVNMQPMGNSLLYLDRLTLKCFDPATEESVVVGENVYEYAVLGETLCMLYYDGTIRIGNRSFRMASDFS